MPERPDIKNIQTGKELKKWYWLKQELVSYCKVAGLSYTGGKFEIIDRIALAFDRGMATTRKQPKLKKVQSTFNWSKALLSPGTIITDSYTNGPNTRKFFKAHCGEHFHFSIPFMEWMKANTSKTLRDAITAWNRLHEQSKNKAYQSVIPKHNQYNQYIRDFFADNPGKTMAEARGCWKLKKALPLGKHIYSRSDLQLKET